MIRRPPRSTRTDTLFPYTTLFRSNHLARAGECLVPDFSGVMFDPAGLRIILGDVLLRSEEHTSELQSLMRISYAVFCLKKKKSHNHHINSTPTSPIPLPYSNHTNTNY